MSFSDAHIKHAVRHCLHHDVHGTARWHGWRYADDARILTCKLKKSLAEHGLEFKRIRAVLLIYALSRLGIEESGGVPDGGLLLRRGISLAFHGVEMQELGAAHVLELFQYAHHLADIVAVERSEVAYVHALEDVLLMGKRRLQGIVKTDESFPAVVIEITFGMEPLRSLEAQTVVCGVGIEIEQILLHAAHGTVNTHIIVIKNDKEVVWRRRHIVKALESQSSRHRTVTDYSNDMA